MSRFDVLREIERLDPARDCQRIMHLSFGYEFCWDSTGALEIALYRTYCVPSISGLLDRSGEFYRHTQRCYDDTAILIAEMCEWGFENGRGKEALERTNWAHGHFTIANDDFLYVLSTFIYEPVRWIDRFAWRPTCRNEKLGTTGSGGRSASAWASATSRRPTRRSRTGRAPTSAARFASAKRTKRSAPPRATCLPPGTRPRSSRSCARPSMPCSTTPCWRRSGFRDRSRASGLVGGMLKLRGRIVRWMPPRGEPHFFTDRPNRTHRSGYEIGALGPARLVAAERRKAGGGAPPGG